MEVGVEVRKAAQASATACTWERIQPSGKEPAVIFTEFESTV